jgi:hypothetical protein
VIRLDRLRLRLPSFAAPHAAIIAQGVGQALAAAGVAQSGHISGLRVGPVRVAAGATAGEVAAAVSRSIVSALARPQGARRDPAPSPRGRR